MRETLATVLVAAMLVVAGCAGGVGTDGSGDAEADGRTAADATGTVNFYISDDPGAIENFEHLNVTITMVGLQKADGGDGDGELEDESETEEDDESGDENQSEEDEESQNETDEEEIEDENETAENDESGDENESGEENDSRDESDGEEETDGDRAGWDEYEVENVTVDLTELQGANATQLDALEAPAGEYDKVFIHVSEVEGVLTTGEEVNVKLPSEKLQIESEFEVAANSSVDFVFDVTVFEAGNSGKYILKPVISESGTGDEVEINDRDDEGDDDRDDEAERDDEDGDSAEEERDGELDAELQGNIEAGSATTVIVSRGGAPVDGATVEVNGDAAGETDADGRLSIDVPADAEELEVTAIDGDDEVEIERDLDRRGDGGQQLLV